ncbi:hypothetical protein [Microbacterium sp. LWO12-1.2]|uniref:hypothetical protein n=1 Tax=Microbacterium sp. LWO12-1.2 TaxID=3135261 RepID=UPI003432BE2A
MASWTYVGPLNFAVFAVPFGVDLTVVIKELETLQRAHSIEVLDIELIAGTADGGVRRETFENASADAAETDLLDDEDLAEIGRELAAGERALVVVYEDRSLAGVAGLIGGLGGRNIWSGGIDAADLDDDSAPQEGAGA